MASRYVADFTYNDIRFELSRRESPPINGAITLPDGTTGEIIDIDRDYLSDTDDVYWVIHGTNIQRVIYLPVGLIDEAWEPWSPPPWLGSNAVLVEFDDTEPIPRSNGDIVFPPMGQGNEDVRVVSGGNRNLIPKGGKRHYF